MCIRDRHKPGEGAKDFLYSLGYRRWDFDTYKYIGASDSAIDAWEREDFATPVSYTHLDVYKRQMWQSVKRTREKPFHRQEK